MSDLGQPFPGSYWGYYPLLLSLSSEEGYTVVPLKLIKLDAFTVAKEVTLLSAFIYQISYIHIFIYLVFWFYLEKPKITLGRMKRRY